MRAHLLVIASVSATRRCLKCNLSSKRLPADGPFTSTATSSGGDDDDGYYLAIEQLLHDLKHLAHEQYKVRGGRGGGVGGRSKKWLRVCVAIEEGAAGGAKLMAMPCHPSTTFVLLRMPPPLLQSACVSVPEVPLPVLAPSARPPASWRCQDYVSAALCFALPARCQQRLQCAVVTRSKSL